MDKALIIRRLKLDESRSSLLLGPRRTGKSTLLKALPGIARYIDLLKSDEFYKYRANPSLLREELISTAQKVVIDEVQLIPELLREVHWLIENTSNTFILSGSSARKLRRSGVTNLAGRLRSIYLCPLTYSEMEDFDLLRYLQFGGLPPIWRDDDPELALRDYCGEYLKEEIQAEGITRNLAGFTRFLEISAAQNGQLLNFTSIGRDSGVSAKTVHEYYQVLVDTLMGLFLEPWIWSKKRRAIRTPKFYWFDCGIPHSLLNRSLSAKTPEFGQSFEHFILLETVAAMRYERKIGKIHYWRSAAGQEVDLIIDDHTAIEIKSGPVSIADTRGLNALAEEMPTINKWIVARDGELRKLPDGTIVMPWQQFIARLGESNFKI